MPALKLFRSCVCVLALAAFVLSTSSCRRRGGEVSVPDYDRALRAGERGIIPLALADYPIVSLHDTDRSNMLTGIDHSLKYMRAASSKKSFPIAGISHAQVEKGLQILKEILQTAQTDTDVNEAIRSRLQVYSSVGYDKKGSVLFTGYYAPIFEASRTRSGRFQHPIYKRPADLISGAHGKVIAQQRWADGSTRPYPSRAELENSGALHGLELFYLGSAFDSYVLQVQGSGSLRMRDGSLIEVGYSGTNGHDYHAISRDMAATGAIAKPGLQAMRDYFAKNPHTFVEYSQRNPRYVFFKEEKGGPYGSIGQTVLPHVSIATDDQIFPRGAAAYVVTTLSDPSERPYSAFRLNQDTGGAIRAAGRCDLYMGSGPHAESIAGRQLAQGRLYFFIAPASDL